MKTDSFFATQNHNQTGTLFQAFQEIMLYGILWVQRRRRQSWLIVEQASI